MSKLKTKSLNCPQCGGTMTVDANHDQYTCPFCGHVEVYDHVETAEEAGYRAERIAYGQTKGILEAQRHYGNVGYKKKNKGTGILATIVTALLLLAIIFGINRDGTPLHIGWNADFRNRGVVFSGDITHSDAAEFIDVDLEKTNARQVNFNINLFSGRKSFKDVEKVFVGMMGIGRNDVGEEFALYDPANCFFSHNLTTKTRNINYGFLDVKNRCLMYLGRDANDEGYTATGADAARSKFSIAEYLRSLLYAQKVTVVDNRDEADLVLVMGKPQSEKEVSLVDNNFFFEA